MEEVGRHEKEIKVLSTTLRNPWWRLYSYMLSDVPHDKPTILVTEEHCREKTLFAGENQYSHKLRSFFIGKKMTELYFLTNCTIPSLILRWQRGVYSARDGR